MATDNLIRSSELTPHSTLSIKQMRDILQDEELFISQRHAFTLYTEHVLLICCLYISRVLLIH